jgi:hypothetical protein
MVKLTKQRKKEKERENQRNQQQEVVDKQTYIKKKIPGSGTIEFQS